MDRKGFGLVEIIIAIAIIAVLAGGGLYFRNLQNQQATVQAGLNVEKQAQQVVQQVDQKNQQEQNSIDNVASSVVSTSSGNSYTNTQYGFQIIFPKGYSIYDGNIENFDKPYFGIYSRLDVSSFQSSTMLVAATNSGIPFATIYFSVWKDSSPGVMKSCETVDTSGAFTFHVLASSSISANNMQFWPFQYDDAGMSKSQTILGYSTLHGNACWSVEVLTVEPPNDSGVEPVITPDPIKTLQNGVLPSLRFLQ